MGWGLLAAILDATPDARGTLFDRERMIPEARQHMAATIGLDRVEFVGGDMFKGIPSGGSIYLFSRVLAGWDDNAIVEVLENCRRGMEGSSSRLLILDRLVVDEGSAMLPALWGLQLLMTIGGRHRTLERFTAALNWAGFNVERIAELPSETTANIAVPNT